MTLTLNRSNTATKGLIVAFTDQTASKSYQLSKPTDLNAMALQELTDGDVQVDITIGQRPYSVLATQLTINGTSQAGHTIDQISDTLSALFLDSSAGGGGTVDNTTPPHIPYKLGAAFENSVIVQNDIAEANSFNLIAGKQEASIQLINNNLLTTKKIVLGNALPVTSPYNNISLLIDMVIKYIALKAPAIDIGDVAISAFGALFRSNGGINLSMIGDCADYQNGTKIRITDSTSIIDVLATTLINIISQLDVKINGATVQVNDPTTSAACISVDTPKGLTQFGDIGIFNNSTKITIDDNNKQITLQSFKDIFLDTGSNGIATIGDCTASGNNVIITVIDSLNRIFLKAGRINIAPDLPIYASNAQAVLAAESIGNIYRSATGQISIVY